jgi:hypothetical protein
MHHIMPIMLASQLCDVQSREVRKQGPSWNGSSHKCRLDLGKEGHQIVIIAPVLF